MPCSTRVDSTCNTNLSELSTYPSTARHRSAGEPRVGNLLVASADGRVSILPALVSAGVGGAAVLVLVVHLAKHVEQEHKVAGSHVHDAAAVALEPREPASR